MEDCHEIHKLGSLIPPFFFHCWFIVDSEFQTTCIEIVGASVNTEATTAAAARRHNTDRRRCFVELGLFAKIRLAAAFWQAAASCSFSLLLVYDADLTMVMVLCFWRDATGGSKYHGALPALQKPASEWQNHIPYEFLRRELSLFWQKKVTPRMTNQALVPAPS